MQHTPALAERRAATDASTSVPCEDLNPTLAARVADAFAALDSRPRARLLSQLLAPVGALALAVVGAGAFAKYLAPSGATEITVSFDDAASVTWDQVYDLVRYVQQSDPGAVQRLLDDLPVLAGRWSDPLR